MAHHYDDIREALLYPWTPVTRLERGTRADKMVEFIKAANKGRLTKKSRKLPTTPRSRVRSALRAVWLRSREHQACLKAAGRACERCGVKASVAKGREVKLQVHHKAGRIGNWEAVIDLVFAELLVDPSLLEAICVECHKAEHAK